jgi:hypothetical protein
LIKEGVCLYHDCLIEQPLSIDIQLFSGFLSALVSFSERINEQAIRNIDFMNSRFSFLKNNDYILIVRTSTERPLTRTLQQINDLNQELNQNQEIMVLLKDTKNFRSLPLQKYDEHLSTIFNNVINQGMESERQLRQIDLMALIQLGQELYQILCQLAFNCLDKMNNALFEIEKGQDRDNILQYVVSQELINFLDLPDLPYPTFTSKFRTFLYRVADIIKNENGDIKANEELFNSIRGKMIVFLSKNHRVLRYFNLDDIVSATILPLFH